MNVASLELSKELYELSGWPGPQVSGITVSDQTYGGHFDDDGNFVAPKFNLGYLLRKLPYDTMIRISRSGFTARWSNQSVRMPGIQLLTINIHRTTPEDAAAKLAIELFKQGALTRGSDER